MSILDICKLHFYSLCIKCKGMAKARRITFCKNGDAVITYGCKCGKVWSEGVKENGEVYVRIKA